MFETNTNYSYEAIMFFSGALKLNTRYMSPISNSLNQKFELNKTGIIAYDKSKEIYVWFIASEYFQGEQMYRCVYVKNHIEK